MKSKGKYYVFQNTLRTFMHRKIINVPKDLQTDHINNNGLDNRKINLRLCTNSQNSQNRRHYTNKSSKYKGVSWHKFKKKWRAQIGLNKKRIHLGYFEAEKEAAKIYNKEAKELFGDFAYINSI